MFLCADPAFQLVHQLITIGLDRKWGFFAKNSAKEGV